MGKYRVVPACTVLFPIGANTGGLFGPGDGLVGPGDGLVEGGDGLVGGGDGVVGTGEGVADAFVTVIVIVSELSVLLTVTLIWLPGAVDVVETVPLNAHPICAERRQPKMISTRWIPFISSDIFTRISLIRVTTPSLEGISPTGQDNSLHRIILQPELPEIRHHLSRRLPGLSKRGSDTRNSFARKYWEIIAGNHKKRGWSLCWVSAVGSTESVLLCPRRTGVGCCC
jgi:hypothetical protein